MKSFFYVLILCNFLFCKSNEFKLLGISSREKEIFYFGKTFAVSLNRIEKDEIDKIKKELKNSYSLIKQENPEKTWEEINSISIESNQIFLFKILPETRVFPEFIQFEFISQNKNPDKIFSYYQESIQSTARSRYFYPGIGYYGGGFGYPYPTGIYPIETDVNIQLTHSYNFVLIFSNKEKISKIRVKTKLGNLIDFEKLD